MITRNPHPRRPGLRRRLLPSLALGVLFAVPAQAGQQAPARTERDATRAVFDRLEALPPIQAGPLTVVPIRARELPEATNVVGHPSLLEASIADPEARRPVIRLHNPTKKPLLVTAGRIAHMAHVDLIVARDAIVPPGETRLVHALPASATETKLFEGQTLTWYPRWAPPELRESIVTDPRSYDVKTFLTLFQEVVPIEEGAKRGLRDVVSSDFGRVLDQAVAKVLHQDAFRADDVIGFVSGVYGQPITLQLYGSAQLHRKTASGLLESHALHAAAMRTRSDLGLELLEGEEAARAVAAAAGQMLDALQGRSLQVTRDGAHLELRGDALRGRGIEHGGALIHLALFAHDPNEKALFSRVFPTGPRKAAPSDR